MISKDELIAALDASQQVVRDVLRDLQSAQAGGEIYPNWTVKEMLAHLAGWDLSSVESLRAYAQDEAPTTPAAADRNFVRFNAGSVQALENRPLDAVIEAWEAAREDFKQAIRDLPEAKTTGPFTSAWGQPVQLDEFVQIFVEHDREHAHEMREKLLPHPGQD